MKILDKAKKIYSYLTGRDESKWYDLSKLDVVCLCMAIISAVFAPSDRLYSLGTIGLIFAVNTLTAYVYKKKAN